MISATDATTVAGLDLRSMSDEALAAMFGDGEQPLSGAAMAEMARRDRAQLRRRKAAQTRAAAGAEWMDAAHAHFLAAEAACAGNLTAPGSRIGEPFPGLYRISDLDFWGTQDMHGSAGRPGQASEEMREFCRSSPRPVRSDFIRRAFAPRKGTDHDYPWRDDPGWSEEAGAVSTGAGGLAEFAPVDAPAYAGAATAAQEPQARTGAGEDLGTGPAADPGAAQRAAARAQRAALLRARRGIPAGTRAVCKHPGRADLCADCPRRAGSAVAIPARGVITPGPASIIAPARQVPDAAEMLPAVLEEIGNLLTDYVWFPSRSAAVTAALWAAHAAARDADRHLIWRASPRLILTSEENGSGKSTVLDLLRVLLQVRSGRMAKVTAPGLAMILDKFRETALPDEVNVTFGTGRDARDVQAVLLAGYSKGGTWVNGRAGGTVLQVYGSAAMAGKDDLITRQRDALKDLLARSVIIRMTRPPVFLPQLDEDGEDRAAVLGRALAAVMGALQGELSAASRDLARELAGSAITDGDGGRVAQIWRPLDAVARIAGGPWPAAVGQARRELAAASGDLLAAQEALDGLEEARAALGGTRRSFWED